MDAMSYWEYIITMSPQKDFSVLPKMPKPSILAKLYLELRAPLSIIEVLFHYMSFPWRDYCINKARYPSSERMVKMIENIPLKPILLKCK